VGFELFMGLLSVVSAGLVISPLLKRHSPENLPCPLFAKEGKFLPFAKGGKEGLEGRCRTTMDSLLLTCLIWGSDDLRQ